MEEKNWSAVGYHRYDTDAELTLLNQIYALLRLQINFFSPTPEADLQAPRGREGDQEVRHRPHPVPAGDGRPTVPKKIKNQLTRQYRALNPAQLRRDLIALSDQLLELVKAKHQPAGLPVTPPTPTRAKRNESTKPRKRAS